MKKSKEIQPTSKRRRWSRPIRYLLVLALGALLVKGSFALGLLSFLKDRHSTWLSTTDVMANDQKERKFGGQETAREAALGPDNEKVLASVSGAASPGARLSYIESREAELNRRERDLQQKEETLKKMELDVQKKFEELSGIQKEIQEFHAERASQQNSRIRSLAKIYENMKPKEAAKLLENLEEQLVVNIISTMNTEVAANILATMDTKKAAKISQVLSTP